MTICYGMIHIMHTCVYAYHVWILVTIAPHSSRVRMDGQDLVEPLVRDGATSSPKTAGSKHCWRLRISLSIVAAGRQH